MSKARSSQSNHLAVISKCWHKTKQVFVYLERQQCHLLAQVDHYNTIDTTNSSLYFYRLVVVLLKLNPLKPHELTVRSDIASSTGWNLWLVCCFESRHTTHTGCLSSRQKSLSFSLCRMQSTSDPAEALWLFSCKKFSHRFFKTTFERGCSRDDLLLQTGHSLDPLVSQYCCRQALQKLWLHDRRTGSLKMSVHTGQDISSCSFEAIFQE